MASGRGSEDVTDVAVGTLVAGRYRVEGLLGEGGMARVFAATSLGDDSTVVVKIPRRLSGSALARFEREVEAISRLDHPSIVRLVDSGVDRGLGVPFMILERVDGRSLGQLVAAEGPLREAEAARILAEVARGLAAAHLQGILHRDLTPQNVMIDHTGRVRILDFGIAKLLAGDTGPPLTQPATTLGTPT